jgi:hypothetical protein
MGCRPPSVPPVAYRTTLTTPDVRRGNIRGNNPQISRKPVQRPARAVTGNSVNGWILWEVKRPGDNDFMKLDWLRHAIPSLEQL